ncbi:DUF4192 domain-containing protein [Nocardia sp. NPDC005366]|uniref:DUF4192 domain-containing protein n=1 Tax=Nocardia sp. NPDC005366 TaxID=3156878 RepID=UPI0033AD3B4C
MTTSTEPHDPAADSAAPPHLVPVTSPRACRDVARQVAGRPTARPAVHAPTSGARISRIPNAEDAFDDSASTEIRSSGVCGESTPRYRDSDHARSLRVDDPGGLIAAIPALVGFAPQRSLVVAVLRSGVSDAASPMIEAVARFDLDPDDGRRGKAAMVTACIAQICAVEQAREVLAVVVDDRLAEPARDGMGTPSDAEIATLITAIDKRLTRRGIDIGGAWAVRAIEADRRWWSLFDRDHHGRVPDPAASEVTLAHVLDGRPIHGSRSELTALVAADEELGAEVAALLPGALATARERFTGAVDHGDLDGYRRNALEYVLWQIADVESGAVPTAVEIAELVAALRDRAVRDTMFALAVGDHAGAAESLWLTLVRALSGPDRAEAAALLGYSAYIRGDGPFAGIALDAALLADPFHPMALLLETSLRAGMRPESLRRLARSGYATASRLGIELGPTVR